MTDTRSTDLQKGQNTMEKRKVEPARAGRLFTAPTDIFETGDSILLTSDMPGVKPEGVTVTLENNVLTVIGMVAEDHQIKGSPGYQEYEVGNYQRSFSLSDEIDRDRIEARMQNGVLTLKLPKTVPSQKKIEVKAG